jgi:drug/metabolite transporter (DMT)-like permease
LFSGRFGPGFPDPFMPRPNITAALWLATLAIVSLAAMSACVHEAAKIAPVGQLVFWRSFVALAPILAYMAIRGQLGALRTQVPGKHVVRSLFGTATMFFSFISLTYLSVGPATALAYLGPVFSVVAAMVVLRERPVASVLAGVVLGFVGIIVMLLPSLVGADLREGMLIGVAAGLAMAVSSAIARVQVKDLTRTEPASTIAFYFALAAAVVGLATAPFGWAELQGQELVLLVAAGCLGGIAHVAMSEAVARAQVSQLAPYEYTGILWAFAADLLFLQVALEPLAVIGALMVVGAAALVVLGRPRRVEVPGPVPTGPA